MTKRNIIKINEDKCNGCGECVLSCAEGAIRIVNGKAKLISEKYCDGLGACLGECPMGAITIEERNAEEFSENLVEEHLAEIKADAVPWKHEHNQKSELSNWPVKLNLVNPQAPYFKDADLVVAADCVPAAFGNFHNDFLKQKTLVIGCPKFDDIQYYTRKLTEIFKNSGVKSITIARMEVPCCAGLTRLVERALEASGKNIPLSENIITIKGEKNDLI